MDFMINITIRQPARQVNYRDKIMLVGSCFTEHIGNSLEELKFTVLQNPNGILFDPDSVCRSLNSYVTNKKYSEKDFFQLNDVWHSWEHHSRYSNVNLKEAVRIINDSQQKAHEFLAEAKWLIITLGSSFSYRLTPQPPLHMWKGGEPVANCHRAPPQWFQKDIRSIEQIGSQFVQCLDKLFAFNPWLNIIFTVSPVRHFRDGVVENNRSKARLIEAVHELANKNDRVYYFPAYELVIDVLRDYRYYDVDLVHPNYMATEFVLEKFEEACIDEESRHMIKEIEPIVVARKHKAFQPETRAHQQFLKEHLQKAKTLQKKYSFLDFEEEIGYFGGRQIL
jgi:hypothetical protein